jgi:molybdate transport system regulatory protein
MLGMKIFTISASYSNLGKTTLARKLSEALGLGVAVLKIGHGKDKSKPEKLVHNMEEAVEVVKQLKKSKKYQYLIIESNSIVKKINSDLAIFIEGYKKPEKDSAKGARKKAHIIISKDMDISDILNALKKKLTEEEIRIIETVIRDFYDEYLVEQLDIRVKIWLDKDEKMVFGPGKYELLKKTEELGSLNKASKDLKMSYRHAWAYIQAMEERLGRKLFKLKNPKAKNSGFCLTDFAKKLISKYEQLLIMFDKT